jgi:SAM-dependent methyltransferase
VTRSATLYDRVPYRTFPRRQLHPDRLAAVAALFGMNPAPVTRCRVLEIGCGNGGNLLPLAYHLPGSRFVGIDLARIAIRAARVAARDLALNNVELRAADLRMLGRADGRFDYILAHGLYSWIPPEVRDCLLAVCRACLAPQGVALVSYNTFPGRYPRHARRGMMLYATRAIADPKRRLRAARRFLKEQGAPEADLPDDVLFHDDLAPINDPVWFHEFAAHAARHRLQYLGDADLHEMFDAKGRLQTLEGEQLLDFRKNRAFRQTLLCREEVPLRRKIGAASMDRFLFSENPHGQHLRGAESVAQALHDAAPLPVAFEELLPYTGGKAALREILWVFLRAGCVDLHVHDFPCQETVTSRPRASRLARYQAARGNLAINACHIPVSLDQATRRLLALLDGTRTRDELARATRSEPDGRLAWMAQMGLLEG